MNKRLLKHLFRKRTFTYESGNIKIKSKMELTNEQISEICNIIRNEVKEGHYYGCYYNIAREITHKMKVNFCRLRFLPKKRKFIITLANPRSMKIKDVK